MALSMHDEYCGYGLVEIFFYSLVDGVVTIVLLMLVIGTFGFALAFFGSEKNDRYTPTSMATPSGATAILL